MFWKQAKMLKWRQINADNMEIRLISKYKLENLNNKYIFSSIETLAITLSFFHYTSDMYSFNQFVYKGVIQEKEREWNNNKINNN